MQQFHEVLAGIRSEHLCATGLKLVGGLIRQIDAVHDEERVEYMVVVLIIVAQISRQQKCQLGLTAALRMPDHTLLRSRVEGSLHRLRGEELRISHDVFLDYTHTGIVDIVLVTDAIVQQEQESLTGEQRGDDAVRGISRIDGVLPLRGIQQGNQIVVLQDTFFVFMISWGH